MPMLWSLFGFGISIIVACFQRCGVSVEYSAVHAKGYLMASGPRCFRFLMLMLSGPVELLFGLFEVASHTCVVVGTICLWEVS